MNFYPFAEKLTKKHSEKPVHIQRTIFVQHAALANQTSSMSLWHARRKDPWWQQTGFVSASQQGISTLLKEQGLPCCLTKNLLEYAHTDFHQIETKDLELPIYQEMPQLRCSLTCFKVKDSYTITCVHVTYISCQLPAISLNKKGIPVAIYSQAQQSRVRLFWINLLKHEQFIFMAARIYCRFLQWLWNVANKMDMAGRFWQCPQNIWVNFS